MSDPKRNIGTATAGAAPALSRTSRDARNESCTPEAPIPAGTLFGGGLYVAHLFDGVRPYVLIAATREGDFDQLPWQAAMEKASALRIGGHSDWTMPNRAEALALFEHLRDPLAKTGDRFERDVYWTSTQPAAGSDYAWYQSFGYGTQDYYRKVNHGRARAVRRLFLQSFNHSVAEAEVAA